MNNAVCGKTMENMRNMSWRKTGKQQKRLLQMDIKTIICNTKIFENDMVAISKIKTILIFNKPAYVWMCILCKSTNLWIPLWLYQKKSLCKKCPCSELFWFAFFPHFPAFGLNTERFFVSLRIQSKCGKTRENADQNNSEYGLFLPSEYGNKSRLQFTDTGSLLHKIETENVYDEFSKNKEMLDFSNYSAKSKSNALVVDKIKDEM